MVCQPSSRHNASDRSPSTGSGPSSNRFAHPHGGSVVHISLLMLKRHAHSLSVTVFVCSCQERLSQVFCWAKRFSAGIPSRLASNTQAA